MKVYIKALVAAVLVGLMFVALFSFWRGRTSPKEGALKISTLNSMEADGVPQFQAKDIHGNPFSITDFRGNAVIVNFWASWCAPCVEEVPSLISLVDAMGGKLKLVAISGDDSKEDIEAFLKAFPKMRGADVTIIWDSDKSLSRLYGVDRLPESFVLGKNLKLSKKILGSIPWHTKESEAYIQQLLEKEVK